jgi:hypothetical protein
MDKGMEAVVAVLVVLSQHFQEETGKTSKNFRFASRINP